MRRGWRRALLVALLAVSRAVAGAAAAPFTVEEVAPGVWVHRGAVADFAPDNRGDIANLAFVVGTRGVLVVDAGGSAAVGRDWVAAIRGVTDRPIRWLVLTHVHPDHVFGAGAVVAAGARVIVGHGRLARALAERGPVYAASMERLLGPEVFAGSEVPAPTRTVAPGERLRLDLGDRTVEIRGWPVAHTDTDLTVLDQATGTLLAGDLVFLDRLPVVDGSLLGWLRVLDELARLPATRVVPGHGPAVAPWPAALAAERRYLRDLRDAVRGLVREGVSLAEAPARIPPPSGWRLVDPDHGRNVTAAYAELEWEE